MTTDAVVSAAERRLVDFERSIRGAASLAGESNPDRTARHAALLAAHAAVPVAIDSGLVNLLRLNFFIDRQPLPYWIEARLLLSPLCAAAGEELYQMDAPVRDLLLLRLAAEYGSERLRQVATLLWQYTDHHPAWMDRRELRHAQQLAALNLLDEGRARAWLEEAEHGAGPGSLPGEWFVAMRATLPPLPEAPPSEWDAARVAAALRELGYETQRQEFRDADTRVVKPVVMAITGPPNFGQSWLIDVLLQLQRPDWERIDVAVDGGAGKDGRALTAVAAALLGAPQRWGASELAEPVGNAVAERIKQHLVALVIRGADNDRRAVQDMLDVWTVAARPDNEGRVLLCLIGEHARQWPPAEGPLFHIVLSLTPLRPFSEETLRRWLPTAANHLDAAMAERFAASIDALLAATGGVPERVFEHLCVVCGVRWPDVQAVLRPSFVRASTPQEQLLELARGLLERRDRMKGSEERNQMMHRSAEEMRAVASQAAQWPLDEWTAGNANRQAQLAAIIALQRHPEASLVPWLAARFSGENPFVGHQAALALLQAAKDFSIEHLEQLRPALRTARAGLGRGKEHTFRAQALREAGEIADRRLGKGQAKPRAATTRSTAARRPKQQKYFKQWPVGSTIRVQFLDGPRALQERVREVAQEWLRYANVQFEWVKKGGAIRITFKEPGNWSYVGVDALQVPSSEPTMTLQSVVGADERTVRRLVLNEFGHALGLISEHMNPKARLEWDVEAVMRMMSGPPNNWTREMVTQHLLTRYSAETLGPYRPFDPKSIMLADLPAEWFKNRQALGGSDVLSKSDRELIAKYYPRRSGSSPGDVVAEVSRSIVSKVSRKSAPRHQARRRKMRKR